VQGILKSAEEEFGRKGYAAATMTAIAEAAGASIGAVYQYFPDKASLAQALRLRYAQDWERHWMELERDLDLDSEALAERIFALMLGFVREHPAYLTLVDEGPIFKKSPEDRLRRRAQLAGLLRRRNPSLNEEEALRIAQVAMQAVKGLWPLILEPRPAEREAWVLEYRRLLAAYLKSRVG